MPASKAQQKAVSKYMKENYDVYQIRMKKGRKDIIQAAAAAAGESVNAYINAAITQRMEREAKERPSEAATGPLRAEVSFPLEANGSAEGTAEG